MLAVGGGADAAQAADYPAGPQFAPGDEPAVAVSRLRLPFFHLVGFFLKAVLAAIPALILLMVGIYGLLFEFSNPGFVLPGVVGAICLMLALFGLQMLPVNYAGLGLILLGVAFLVAEAFLPSFGALGLGGIAAFAIGTILLIDSDAPGFGVPLWLIALMSAVSAVFILLVAGMAAKARRRPVVSGVSTLVGTTGDLVEFSGGEGWARIQGDYWKVSGAEDLRAGRRIRVTRVQGRALHVAAQEQDATTGA